jgi:hypothetical protein
MNTDDINLAYKIRHALNDNLDNLPASTTDRLAAARAAALARKKADAPRARQQRASFDLGALFSMQWVARAAVVAPLLLMAAGMVGVYQYEREQRAAELAELDAAVLSDDLPLTAYTDHGFNAYLAQQQQAQQQPQRAQ